MGYKALIILNIVLLAVIARLVFKPLSPAPGIRVWEGETWTAAQYGSRYILSIKPFRTGVSHYFFRQSQRNYQRQHLRHRRG